MLYLYPAQWWVFFCIEKSNLNLNLMKQIFIDYLLCGTPNYVTGMQHSTNPALMETPMCVKWIKVAELFWGSTKILVICNKKAYIHAAPLQAAGCCLHSYWVYICKSLCLNNAFFWIYYTYCYQCSLNGNGW